jgi:tRNA threonylcarbamoyladenosine biosynthesis protein TsaE
MFAPAHQIMKLVLHDDAATARAGALIAPHIVPGMVVTLDGDLGAGKTTLVRGLLRAAGVSGPIKSPTFNLVEHYPLSSIYFYHIDLYRFNNAADWENSGLAECFRADAACLVEWPSRLPGMLPPADLALTLLWPPQGEGRLLQLHAHSATGERCRDALIKALPAA